MPTSAAATQWPSKQTRPEHERNRGWETVALPLPHALKFWTVGKLSENRFFLSKKNFRQKIPKLEVFTGGRHRS